MRCIVIAHRGDSAHHPENTLLAFRKAVDAGADMVELDVRLTGDHKVAVCHDANLLKLFQKKGPVSRLSYKSIQERTRGAVPLLTDVLDAFRGKIKFFIEVKVRHLSPRNRVFLVREVLAQIQKRGMQKDCIVASFDYRVAQECRRLAPTVRTGFIFLRERAFRALWDHHFSHVDVICPRKDLFTPGFSNVIKSLRKKVFSWVLDDCAEAQRALQWGVDGIITNDPGALVKYFAGRDSACSLISNKKILD